LAFEFFGGGINAVFLGVSNKFAAQVESHGLIPGLQDT
jgi:hypothetical protein